MFEIKYRFGKCCEKLRKNFSFLDNFIWNPCRKFSLLLRKYFSSGVNVLTNSLKIWNITKRDIFQLKFSQSDEQGW